LFTILWSLVLENVSTIKSRSSPAQHVVNIRAVPLVHEDDAHQGRVSFYLSDSLL
jgi:hypothetical protein